MAGQHVADPPRGEVPDGALTAMAARDSDTGAVRQTCEGRITRPAEPVTVELGRLASIRQLPDPHGLVGVEGDRDRAVPRRAGDAEDARPGRLPPQTADEPA